MTNRFLVALCIVSAGVCCIQCASPSLGPAPTASVSDARTIDSFGFIGPGTRLPDVVAKFGEPDRDAGSGIYIYAYRLSDGTEVFIGSPDRSEILYVRHGSTTLYERR
jgi:hypothetical protein